MKKTWLTVSLLAFLTDPALAAGLASLPAGEPAGVRKAQDENNNTALFVIGGGVLVAGIAVLASHSNSAPAPGTTATTTTT